MKERKQKELSSLFVKPVPKAKITRPSSERFKTAKKEHEKLDKQIEKLEHDQEELEAPIYKAKLEALGLTSQQFMDILKQGEKINGSFMNNIQRTDMEYFGYALPDFHQMEITETSRFQTSRCTDINVRVCKDRVCVDQPIAMNVSDIWLSGGSDTSFTKLSQNSFKADDSVEGSSSWNYTYHRQSQTHEGEINILASIELTESSLIKGMGMVFNHLVYPNGLREWNGYVAHGKDPGGLPPSWGRVKMYWDINIRYKKPGEGETIWFDYPKIKCTDYGPVESNVSAHADIFLGEWVHENGSKDLVTPGYGQFPAGTQFTFHVLLSYWIKGKGSEGSAEVSYGNVVNPYIKIESCSYEYPEYITIHVPNYLP